MLPPRRELNRLCSGIVGGIVPGVDLGFKGEVADLYHRYRHGYPGTVLDALVGAFGLTGQDVVVDLGRWSAWIPSRTCCSAPGGPPVSQMRGT